MKRLDLIFNEKELKPVIKILEEHGITGYSVIKHVTGKGPNSTVYEDLEFTGIGGNAHMIIFCQESLLGKLHKGKLLDQLNYYGGVAYVSDAITLGDTN